MRTITCTIISIAEALRAAGMQIVDTLILSRASGFFASGSVGPVVGCVGSQSGSRTQVLRYLGLTPTTAPVRLAMHEGMPLLRATGHLDSPANKWRSVVKAKGCSGKSLLG